MLAVGMLLIWAGYGVGLEGWCLFKDYDVTLGQLMSPFHPYAGPWPPAKLGSDVIWPGGRSSPAPGAVAAKPGQSAASKAAGGFNLSGTIQKVINYLPGIGPVK